MADRAEQKEERLVAAADSFLGHARHARGLSDQTLRAYANDLEQFVEFAARRGVVGIDGVDLELLRDWLWEADQRGSHGRRSPAGRRRCGRSPGGRARPG
ncbi:site-specific integrase [Sphingomonas sp. LR61]|uniref:site-specific integrase n=1 Tax=Sphingomonas sp. LR61 TaxID=3050234 RepID=UPI002FE35648